MRKKSNRIGKKGGLLDIAMFSLVLSVISIIYIFISVFGYTVANDYIFYPMQNLTESLEANSIVTNGTAAITQTYGEDFQNFNLQIDNLWLIAYIIFIVSSFSIAYKSKEHTYFSFLSLLFYGTMVFLFFLTLFSTFTNWFKDSIMLAILPNANLIVPKFYFYLDNIGIFSGVHFVICIFLSIVDFDFAKIFQRKKIEQQALENDNEVV